jgi:uncharacterized membrane protein YfcA
LGVPVLAAAIVPGVLIGAALGLLGGGGSVLRRGFALFLVVMAAFIFIKNLMKNHPLPPRQ